MESSTLLQIILMACLFFFCFASFVCLFVCIPSNCNKFKQQCFQFFQDNLTAQSPKWKIILFRSLVVLFRSFHIVCVVSLVLVVLFRWFSMVVPFCCFSGFVLA